MRIATLTGLVLVLGAALVADVSCMKCGEKMAEKMTEKALETAVEKGTGGKVDIDVGSVDISGLPAFLRYPGAKAIGKWSITTDDGSGSVYNLETGDGKAKVADWYKASFDGQGWKQGATMETGDAMTYIFASPDEKETATVVIATDEGKTTLAITYAKK